MRRGLQAVEPMAFYIGKFRGEGEKLPRILDEK